MQPELKIYKRNANVKGIAWGSASAACFDISANIAFQSSLKMYTKSNKFVEVLASNDDIGSYVDIPAEWRILVPTGMFFDIPKDHSIKVYPRSGLSTRLGLNLINCVGIIDEDYTDELFIPLYNNSQEKVRIYHGDRIAQGELAKVERPIITYINESPQRKGNREGGFGSTGV